jgi:hypothetical protein
MASRDEIGVIWRLMTTNYSYITKPQPSETVNDAAERMASLFDIWVRLLADLPVEILRASALQHISESKWFPAVSDLRDAAARILYPRRQTAIEAWGEVRRAFGRWWPNGMPEFSDDVTTAVVAELGWHSLCMSECQEADRARFLQGYDEHIKRERSSLITLPEVKRIIVELAEQKSVGRLTDGNTEK